MSKSILMSASTTVVGAGGSTTKFWNLHGGLDNTGTESQAQQKVYTGGTYSFMRVNVTVNTETGTSTFIFRKNGANGNQTFPVAASGTGVFVDATNTDTVVTGDLVNLKSTGGSAGGSWSLSLIASVFETGDSTTVTKMTYGIPAGTSGMTAAATTWYPPLMGSSSTVSVPDTTEANSQSLQRVSGTFKNLSVSVLTNSRTTIGTVTFRKNGSNGNQTIPITAGGTGIFEDVTHTDTVVANDLVNYSYTSGAADTAAISINSFSSEFKTTSTPAGTMQFVCSKSGSTALTLAAAATRFVAIGGKITVGTTESVSQLTVYDVYTFHDLSINLTTNPVAGASSLTLRQNTADSTLVAPITGATTGWFTDSTHTVTTAANDVINLKLVTGAGSGSITYAGTSLFADFSSGVTPITCTVTGKTVTNKFITIH
jgi:hypothetical protein